MAVPARPGADGTWFADEPVTPLSIWKIADNLRRSLVPGCRCFLLLVGGWIAQTGSTLSWSLLVVAACGLPRDALASPSPSSRASPPSARWPEHAGVVLRSARGLAGRAGLAIAAASLRRAAAASMRSCAPAVRMAFTRRGLFLWHPRHYQRRSARTVPGRRFSGRCGSARPRPSTLRDRAFRFRDRKSSRSPRRCSSSGSPRRSSRIEISRPVRSARSTPDAGGGCSFEASRAGPGAISPDFASEGEGWLAPDNMQEVPTETHRAANVADQPGDGAARPTWRPTTSATSPPRRFCAGPKARSPPMESLSDFGATSTTGTTPSTLQPLTPLYVSSVDSGNLAASLVAVACRPRGDLARRNDGAPRRRRRPGRHARDCSRRPCRPSTAGAADRHDWPHRGRRSSRAPVEAVRPGAASHEIRREAAEPPSMIGPTAADGRGALTGRSR
mgnify:CR=1 FL=1